MRRVSVRLLAALALAGVGVMVACSGGSDDASTGSTSTTVASSTTTAGPGTTGGGASSTGASQIETIQKQLSGLGCDPGPIDGKYGPATLAAIAHFQNATGLEPSGKLTPETARAIGDKAGSGTVCTSKNVPTDSSGKVQCTVGVDAGCGETPANCPAGEECLQDPATNLTQAQQDGIVEVVRGQYASDAVGCEDGTGFSEIYAASTVELTGGAEGLVEGTVTWEGHTTVPFSVDQADYTVTWGTDVCVGLGE